MNLKDLKKEIPYKTRAWAWSPIDNFEGYYEISNFWRVRSLDREYEWEIWWKKWIRRKKWRLLSNRMCWSYYAVQLCKNNKPKNYYIHRLVWKAFVDNPDNKPEINHIDWDKLNNYDTNLQWCTASENKQHAQDTWLNRARFSEKQKQAAKENVKKTPSYIKHLNNKQYELST